MTIERFDIEFLTELADDERVTRVLAPADRDQRLRLLTGCLILRDFSADGVAVFQHVMLADWRAVIFNIDDGPTAFVIDCLDYLFATAKVLTLRLTSKTREVGAPLRAVFLGPMQTSQTFVWSLSFEDWREASILLKQALPRKPEKRRVGSSGRIDIHDLRKAITSAILG